MGECKLDHTMDDVMNKLESQKAHLPEQVYAGLLLYLRSERQQPVLNELFHLLKKYDLSPEVERQERNRKLRELIG
jgi:hypothetical protein